MEKGIERSHFGERRKSKFRKQAVLILILMILLAVAAGYIGIGKYNEGKEQKENELLQQGAQLGYEQAIVQLVGEAVNCQPVPLFVGNQSINVIAVECLQQ